MNGQLPMLTPDASRISRTLARCHEQLDRRRADARAARRYALERTALLGFGAIYMSAVAFTVVQVLVR